MHDENHEKEEHDLPFRKRLKVGSNTGDVAEIGRDGEQPNHSLLAYCHPQVATDLGPSDPQHPGSPGIFFQLPNPALSFTNAIPIPGISDAARLAEYHDSDSGDIYDLYNACNGVVHDGYLDVRKLEELTAEEQAFLDIERLKEIWRHTKTGCVTCAGIIRTLNSVRGMLTEETESLPEAAFCADSEPH